MWRKMMTLLIVEIVRECAQLVLFVGRTAMATANGNGERQQHNGNNDQDGVVQEKRTFIWNFFDTYYTFFSSYCTLSSIKKGDFFLSFLGAKSYVFCCCYLGGCGSRIGGEKFCIRISFALLGYNSFVETKKHYRERK